MNIFGSIFGTFRDAVLLTERLNSVSNKAEEALTMTRENRERIVRLETLMEVGMRFSERRLPRD